MSFVERISTPLFSQINLVCLQEPHTELGLWHVNSNLFLEFTNQLNTLDKATVISEMGKLIFSRPCKPFPQWLVPQEEQNIILEKLCAWVLCCGVYNFLYSKTDMLKKPD